MQYCLPIGQFVENQTITVQFSSVQSLCVHLNRNRFRH